MMKKRRNWLTLRKKVDIIWALVVVGCLLAVAVAFFFDIGLQLMLGAWACFILGIILELIWWRCPYCGSYLSRGQKDGEYCRKCGKRVFWDNHDDFQDLEEN